MIVKNLKIFSQNIQKNNFIINTILKVNHNFDVIFIQEPSWTTIRSIPSSGNCEGVPLVGVPNHPNWLIFARESNSVNDSPRVIIYINIRLLSLWFSLCKNIINHKDILLISFFNNNNLTYKAVDKETKAFYPTSLFPKQNFIGLQQEKQKWWHSKCLENDILSFWPQREAIPGLT